MTAACGDKTATRPALRPLPREHAALNSKAVESADTTLRRDVLARLIADPLVRTGHVGVAATAGRVTLSGYVTSNAQKDAARAATRRVKGVKQVADDIRVAVPCPDLADSPAEDLEARPTIAAPQPFKTFKRTRVTQTDVRRPN